MGFSEDGYGPVLFRAGAGGRTWWLTSALPVGIGLLIAIGWGLMKLEEDPGAAIFAIGLTVVVVVGLFAFTLFANSRSRVAITDTHVLLSRPFGQDVIDRREIAVAVAPQRVAAVGVGGQHVFLLGHDGRRLALINGTNWEPGLVRQVAQVAPVVHEPTRLTPTQARERWPGMLPWSWQNPGLAAATGGAGALLLVGALVGVASLASNT